MPARHWSGRGPLPYPYPVTGKKKRRRKGKPKGAGTIAGPVTITYKTDPKADRT